MTKVLEAVAFALLTAISATQKVRLQQGRQLLTILKVVMVATFAFTSWTQVTRPGKGLGRAFLPVMLLVPLGVVGVYAVRMRRHPLT